MLITFHHSLPALIRLLEMGIAAIVGGGVFFLIGQVSTQKRKVGTLHFCRHFPYVRTMLFCTQKMHSLHTEFDPSRTNQTLKPIRGRDSSR